MHQGACPRPEWFRLTELAKIFTLQKGPERDGELSKVTQGVREEARLEPTGPLSL